MLEFSFLLTLANACSKRVRDVIKKKKIRMKRKKRGRKEGKCCITCIGLLSGNDSLTDMKYSGVVIKKKKEKEIFWRVTTGTKGNR